MCVCAACVCVSCVCVCVCVLCVGVCVSGGGGCGGLYSSVCINCEILCIVFLDSSDMWTVWFRYKMSAIKSPGAII